MNAQPSEDGARAKSAYPRPARPARRLGGAGLSAAVNRQAQGQSAPAPPAKGQGQRQHSPGGRRHASPAPASREVGRQLKRPECPLRRQDWMGGARAGLNGPEPGAPVQSPPAKPTPRQQGAEPGGGGESVWSPASCCRQGVRLGCGERPLQNRSEHARQ